jgi:hypothetical protein
MKPTPTHISPIGHISPIRGAADGLVLTESAQRLTANLESKTLEHEHEDDKEPPTANRQPLTP